MRAAGNLWGMTCAVGAALCVVLPCAHGAETPGTDDTSAATEGEVIGRWDLLPVPVAESSAYQSGVNHVYDTGVDDGDIVYLLANRSLYYWDGKQFAKAFGASVTPSPSIVRFVGGPDRGLYLTQKGDCAFQGKLYRLSDAEAKFVTDFYCEDFGSNPRVYVSRSGRLICWGKRFVSWYADGKWRRVETPMLLAMPQIFDMGEAVHVYYDSWLLTIGADGTPKTRELDVPLLMEPGRTRVRGVLWGERTALLVKEGTSVVHAFTLPEGTPVPTGRVERSLKNHCVGDMFRGNDGTVWLFTRGGTGAAYSEGFVVLKPDGGVLSGDKAPALEWESGRTRSRTRSVLVASDGTLWLAEAHGGVAAYRSGTLTRFGWRQGIKRPCNWLAEGPRGEIYAGLMSGATSTLYVFHGGKPPNEPPEWAELWHEHRLTCSSIVQDAGGAMWMCLADRPSTISRWDGRDWTEMSVPFDTASVVWLLPDDQGCVVVRTSRGRYSSYLVEKDVATGYDGLTNAIAAAVGKGARRFYSGSDFPCCIVMDDGKIWLAQARYSSVEHFDGKHWDMFRFDSERVARLDRDKTYGFVVCMESGKRFGYDRGQFVRLPDGEPLRRRHDEPTVFPSVVGGHWIKPSFRQPFMRSFGGTEFACDFAETPFPRGFTPRLILEDAAGNLWIDTWGGRNWRRVFMKEMAGFRLRVADVPKRVPRSLNLDVEVVLDDEPQVGWRVFYRLKDGGWQGGKPGPELKIEFPEDGTYEVEVIGMGPIGGTTPKSLKFTVESKKQ